MNIGQEKQMTLQLDTKISHLTLAIEVHPDQVACKQKINQNLMCY